MTWNPRRIAAVLFVIAGVVAFARVGIGLARGTGWNIYEVAMGVLAMFFAYVSEKVWST
jgi:hypothetical protein